MQFMLHIAKMNHSKRRNFIFKKWIGSLDSLSIWQISSV